VVDKSVNDNIIDLLYWADLNGSVVKTCVLRIMLTFTNACIDFIGGSIINICKL
jgi:hypothetical protein